MFYEWRLNALSIGLVLYFILFLFVFWLANLRFQME